MAGYGKVTAPRRWQSSPDSPPTQLAYVTQPEIDLLVDADIHGSMRGSPNRGPHGIMSLDGDYVMSWSPPSQPSGGGGGDGGGGSQGGGGPHWDPPPPVVTVPPPWVADTPTESIGPVGGPIPVIETGPTWDDTDDIMDLIGAPTDDTGVTSTSDIIDVAAEQDAIDDAVAMANVPPDIYTPSEDIYPWLEGGIPEDWINVSQVGGGPNSPGSLLYGIDLESYGFDPKGEFLPKNFLEMLFEGSIVSGNEAVLSDEPNIGTWEMVEAGTHPLFPGGQEDYYDPFGNLGAEVYTPTDGGGYYDDWGDWGGGGQGPAGMTLAEYARQHWFSESLSDVEAKEAQREAEGLGAATMSDMERMYAKDFAAEARQPDPFFDPEFSYEMYEDYDPIYAGMDLFQRARG